MNVNLSNKFLTYSVTQEMLDPTEGAIVLHGWIQIYTTPAQFEEKVKTFDKFELNHCTLNSGFTPLHDACFRRNIPLIEHIVKIGGKSLLLLNCMNKGASPRLTPLHIVCDKTQHVYPLFPSLRNNSSGLLIDRGYLAAKKLLQLGSPVNLVDPNDVEITPLDIALMIKNIAVAVLLLRNGGIACRCDNMDIDAEFKKAQKEIMYPNEKLFKMHFSDLTKRNVFEIPRDVINYILFLSVKLELQD